MGLFKGENLLFGNWRRKVIFVRRRAKYLESRVLLFQLRELLPNCL